MVECLNDVVIQWLNGLCIPVTDARIPTWSMNPDVAGDRRLRKQAAEMLKEANYMQGSGGETPT